MKKFVIIGARKNSKAIKDKNLQPINNIPLLAYPILTARQLDDISKIIVSSDSEEYLDLAKSYGAMGVFRPDAFATDTAGDYEWINHILEKYEAHFSNEDILIFLRPTTPLRDPRVIEKAFELLNPFVDSMRSVQELPEPIEKMVYLEDHGWVTPVWGSNESVNATRQSYSKAYHPNGYFEFLRPRVIRESKILFGKNVYGYVTPKTIEIDDMEDLEMARRIARP